MTDVVFRHGPHHPKQPIVGYAPKPGDVRDEQGRLILVYRYGGRGGGKSVAAELHAQAVEAAGGKVLRNPVPFDVPTPAPTKRGVRAEQEKLL